MNRDKIIKKTLVKLGAVDRRDIQDTVRDIERVYRKHKRTDYKDNEFPKDLVKFMEKFIKDESFEQKDKLLLFNELKKKRMFQWNMNKNLEKAWRFIFKKWDLSNLNYLS